MTLTRLTSCGISSSDSAGGAGRVRACAEARTPHGKYKSVLRVATESVYLETPEKHACRRFAPANGVSTNFRGTHYANCGSDLSAYSSLCESAKRLQILKMQQHMGPATPYHQHRQMHQQRKTPSNIQQQIYSTNYPEHYPAAHH